MIPEVNIKNSLKCNSDTSRMKEEMKFFRPYSRNQFHLFALETQARDSSGSSCSLEGFVIALLRVSVVRLTNKQ